MLTRQIIIRMMLILGCGHNTLTNPALFLDVPTFGMVCAKKFIIIILISVYTILKIYRVRVYNGKK